MIEITLKFTSIAEAAAALTLMAGTPARAAHGTSAVSAAAQPDPKEATKESAGKPKAASPSPAQVAASSAQPDSAAKPAAAPAPATGAEPIDYAVLRGAVQRLAARSKDAALAIRDSFGVDHFEKVPVEKRGEALALVEAKIKELEAAK